MSISNEHGDTYHHGDLRNALIEAGVAMLAQEGLQGLSMRKLAKQAGVSHNAPYMHFADKEALLAAIAEEGFGILANEVGSATTAAGADWHGQLRAASWAYVRFALQHPSHFQVMFRGYDPDVYPTLSAASLGALGLLRQVIETGQESGLVVARDSQELAALTWSLLHGVATILAAHKMPADVMGSRSAEELLGGYLDLLYHGLAGPHRESWGASHAQ